jgi:acyl carrier protein
MEQRIATLMAELFDMEKEDVTDDLAMKETDGWDSLKHMEFIVSIEQAFDVELAFDDIIAMHTVRDVKSVLKGKGVNGDHGSTR